MPKSLDTPIQYLKGIGPKRAELLQNLGIGRIEDLLYYFPKRYEDRSQLLPISRVRIGELQTIKGTVLAKGLRRSFRRRGFNIFELAVGDSTGRIFSVWFNQSYLKDYFKVGAPIILYGKVEDYKGRLQMNSPEFEILSEEESDSLSVGRIIPIYSLTEGITQRYFRQIVKNCLEEFVSQLEDSLPYNIRSKYDLLNLAQSLINIHFSENFKLREEAYKRLSFEEFFIFQLSILLRKLKQREKKGISHRIEGGLVTSFIESLNFSLTQSQKKVLEEIKRDMASVYSMRRLLQGDVGCGKTVVAVISAVIAIQGGYQVAFMVPTEILAFQHYENIKNQISKITHRVNVSLLTSSLNKKAKDKIYQQISEGRINLVIGTHALLEEELEFKSLGLVIIDEQHKFGVSQRALLPKKGINPDILIMTATPIPRTLAACIYGDLDISVITDLPPQRKPVETLWFDQAKRDEVYKFILKIAKEGKQAYIVYPIIEESRDLDLKAARQMYEELKEGVFKEFCVSLIHGRLSPKEQEKIMFLFSQGKIQILVATTVLEVGLDIPNAAVMVVEHAERFGLAQLHQLRGRVGRGKDKSYFIVISSNCGPEAMKRLEVITKFSDGFKISQEDLKIRGPGKFFGKRQSGLSELKIADPLKQMDLLRITRREAVDLLGRDPKLKERSNLKVRQAIEKRLQIFLER